MPVEVRRVRPEDWPAVRQLRLEALADTPIGFLETLADARAKPDADWQARAARGAAGGAGFQVLAFDGERPVGNSVCFLADGRAWLGAVYVATDHRGQGLLARLVEACSAWAREQGVDALHLEVHETNARARTAYERLGFVDTGARTPYPLEPGGEELLMERSLDR